MISWSEWWQSNIGAAKFPFSLEEACEHVQARATKHCKIGPYQVPELGDFNALESWLMDVATLDATRVLLETQLRNCQTVARCASDTELNPEAVEAAFRLIAEGGVTVPVVVIDWLSANNPEFGEDVILNCSRILKYEKLGVLMACRVDASIDWVSYFLNGDRLVTETAQALFDRESGIAGDELEGEIPNKKK